MGRKLERKLLLSTVAVFVLLSCNLYVSVEAEAIMWSQTYGGVWEEIAYSLAETSDGGFVIAGSATSFGAGVWDFWLVKTDAYGNMEWNRTYGEKSRDIAYSVVETFDGGFAIAGASAVASSIEGWLIKTDELGNIEWNKTYGGPNSDDIWVVLISEGGYTLAGSTESFAAGGWDFWLIKTDENGTVLWNQTYGGMDVDFAHSLIETTNGGYAVAGYTTSYGAGLEDFWLVKTDELGNMEWNQTYGGADYDRAQSLVETSDGGYAIAGRTESFGHGNGELWLVKTDSSGNAEWNRTYGAPSGDSGANSLVETSDGGYAMAGYRAGDFWLVKTDVYGNVEWSQTYGGANFDVAWSLVKTSDGGYAIAGRTESFGAGWEDFWLVKTNETGTIPEYSSWLLQSLLLVATLVIVVYKKKLLNPSS